MLTTFRGGIDEFLPAVRITVRTRRALGRIDQLKRGVVVIVVRLFRFVVIIVVIIR